MSNKDKLDITKITDTYSKVETDKSKADEMFRELHHKIWQGETTGDIIKDFIIVWNNKMPTSEDEKLYKDLEYQLNNNIGEPLLIVSKDEGIEGCPGRISPPSINPIFLKINTTYDFGVINSKVIFNIQTGNIVLPMTQHKHLTYTTRYKNYPKVFSECLQDMYIGYPDIQNLDKIVKQRTRPMANNGSEKFQRGKQVYTKDDAMLFLQGAFYNLPKDAVEDIYGEISAEHMKTFYRQALEWLKK